MLRIHWFLRGGIEVALFLESPFLFFFLRLSGILGSSFNAEFYQFLSRILFKIGVKFRGVFGTGNAIKKEAEIDENSMILDVFGSSRGVSGRLGASRNASGRLALPKRRSEATRGDARRGPARPGEPGYTGPVPCAGGEGTAPLVRGNLPGAPSRLAVGGLEVARDPSRPFLTPQIECYFPYFFCIRFFLIFLRF